MKSALLIGVAIAALVIPAAAQPLEPPDQRWSPRIKMTPNQAVLDEAKDQRIRDLESKIKQMETEKAASTGTGISTIDGVLPVK